MEAPTMIQPEEVADKEETQHKNNSFTDVIAKLPVDDSWRSPRLYLYRNFWYIQQFLPFELSFHDTFQSRPTDLFLITQPKSGTTWLKALAFSILHRFHHPIHSPNHPLLTSNPHTCVPFVRTYYTGEQTLHIDSLPSPRLLACHTPYSNLPHSLIDSDARIIYLCREPKDTFISFWHFVQVMRPDSVEPLKVREAFDVYCRGISAGGPVWEHQLEYWQASLQRPEKIMFLKYEEMKAEGGDHVRRIAEFMGCPITSDEEEEGVVEGILSLCSFEKLSSLEVNRKGSWGTFLTKQFELKNSAFFRQGEVGDWRRWMSEEMGRRMDEITEEKFKGSGLSFAS